MISNRVILWSLIALSLLPLMATQPPGPGPGTQPPPPNGFFQLVLPLGTLHRRDSRALTISGSAPTFTIAWTAPTLCDDAQLFRRNANGYIYSKAKGENYVFSVISNNRIVASNRTQASIWVPDGDGFKTNGLYLSGEPGDGTIQISVAASSDMGITKIAEPATCFASCFCYGDPHFIRFDNGRGYDSVPSPSTQVADCGGLKVSSIQLPRLGAACISSVVVTYLGTTVSLLGVSCIDANPVLSIDMINQTVLAPGSSINSGLVTIFKKDNVLHHIITPKGIVQFISGSAAGATIIVNCTAGPILNKGLCGATAIPSQLPTPPPLGMRGESKNSEAAVRRARDIADACSYVDGNNPFVVACGGVVDDIKSNCIWDVGLFGVQAAAPIIDVFILTCAFGLAPPVASAIHSYVLPPTSLTTVALADLDVQIQAVDAWGDKRTTFGDAFSISIAPDYVQSPFQPLTIPALPTESVGKYRGVLSTPLIPGGYRIDVKQYGLFHIIGSPLFVTALELPSVPLLCTAIGPGLLPVSLLSALLGGYKSVTITATTTTGVRTTGGELFSVAIAGSVNWNGVVADLGNGQYSFTYQITGILTAVRIYITLGGNPIFGSPFTILSIL